MPNPHVSSLSATNFEVAYHTDAGRSGKNNEDNYALFETKHQNNGDPPVTMPAYVAVVADGIGGSASGEIASDLAIEAFVESLKKSANAPFRLDDRLDTAIQYANRRIYERAKEMPEAKGMGTTIVVAVIVSEYLYLAHAGDSRAYLIRNGKNYLLTLDHTWVQEALDAGYLSLEQAANHPNKNVIKRYLGPVDHVEVDHQIIEVEQRQTDARLPKGRRWVSGDRLKLQAGDTLLLCSDGLADVVSDDEMARIVGKYEPRQAVRELIRAANAAGGPDNITAIILHRTGTVSRRTVPDVVDKPRTEPWQPANVAPVNVDAIATEQAATQAPTKPAKTKQTPKSQRRTSGFGIATVGLLVALIAVGGWVFHDKWGPYFSLGKMQQVTTAPTQNNSNQTTTPTQTVTVNAAPTLVTITPDQSTPIAIAAVRTPATNTTNSSTTTILAEAQVTPTATNTQLPTVTPPAILYTATPSSSATSTVTTLPTSTLLPTSTSVPTETSLPTSTPVPTATATQKPNPPSYSILPSASSGISNPAIDPTGLKGSVKLGQPEDNMIVSGPEVTFNWILLNRNLPAIQEALKPNSNFMFEPIIISEAGHIGLTAANHKQDATKLSIDALKGPPWNLEDGKDYQWTVRLGNKNGDDFQEIGLLAEPHKFTFKPATSGPANGSPKPSGGKAGD